MSEEELQKKEEEEFNTGPLSLLTQSVKYNTQVEYIKGLNNNVSYYFDYRFLSIVVIIVNCFAVSKPLIDTLIWY